MTKYLESNIIGGSAITTDVLPLASLVAPGTQAYDADLGVPVYSNGASWIPVSGGTVTGVDTTLTITGTILSASPLNILPGAYLYSTLPSATLNAGKFAATTDQGAVFSKGGFWQILYNATTGTLAIANNTPLTPATQSVAYSLTLTCTAGVAPYSWSMVSTFGAANTWTLSSAGVLTGTPGTLATESLMIQVSDATGAVTQKLVTLKTIAATTPAATPTFSPVAGTYVGTQTVTITCSTPSSTIYYTTNGSTPSTGSPVYTSPLTVSASQTIQAIATAAGFTQSATGSAAYVINAAAVNKVGANGMPISYFTPEMPFLNIFKQAGNNGTGVLYGGLTGWFTQTGTGIFDTLEEAYLQLDSSGYPTTLTALGGHSQVYDRVSTVMNEASLGFGESQTYPGGSYTFQFQGAGTIVLGRDVTSGSLATSSPNVSVTGLTITSTQGAGNTAVVTFTVVPTAGGISGIQLTLTATTGGNYLKAFQICETQYVSNLAAGQVYHPLFKAALANFSCWRGMKWTNTEIQDWQINFAPLSTGLALNATSGTLYNMFTTGIFPGVNPATTGASGTGSTATITFGGGTVFPVGTCINISGVTPAGYNGVYTITASSAGSVSYANATTGAQTVAGTASNKGNWPFPTGTYNMVAATGQTLAVTCTADDPRVTWTPALSAAIPSFNTQTAANMVQMVYSPTQSWATRPLATDAFWSTFKGVPYEALMQLGNEMGIDVWANIPAVAYVLDSTYATHLAQLALSGTGSTLPIFTGLNSAQVLYVEFTNEPWNGTYVCQPFSMTMGLLLVPAQANAGYRSWNWIGSKIAAIGDAFFAVYGSALASNGVINGATRAVVSMTGQYSDPDFLVHTMNAPDWVALGNTAPYLHHIGGYHTAPYFPGDANTLIAADMIAILGSAVPLDTFFGLQYAGTFGGHTYTSTCIGSAGFLGSVIAQVASDNGAISGQPWAAWPKFGYEGGSGWVPFNNKIGGLSGAQQTAWLTLMQNATRDIRMGYIYYDPTHVLSANPGYLPSMKAAGFNFINQFTLLYPASTNGIWGAIEGRLQVISPLSSAPYKWQYIEKYITNS